MNDELILAIINMGDANDQMQIADPTKPGMTINVAEIDKQSARLLRIIRVAFKELADDPAWVMSLLNSAQFWLTLGCTLQSEPEQPAADASEGFELSDALPQAALPVELIPPIPKREWNA